MIKLKEDILTGSSSNTTSNTPSDTSNATSNTTTVHSDTSNVSTSKSYMLLICIVGILSILAVGL